MTVSTQVSRNEYTGNGATTQYDFTFRILDKSHLLVQTLDNSESIVTLTLGTDYTVTGVNRYNGGKVVLTSALPAGYKISIERSTPVTQEASIRNQGGFFPEIHEDAFDKLTMLVQQAYGWWSGLSLRKPSWLANYYDALNNRIRNLRDPSQAQDAATKNYVDGQIVDNTNAWKAGDAILDQKIDSNFRRSLRVPDSYVEELPQLSMLEGKILAFSGGRPVGVLPESGSAADVLIELAKPTGADLVYCGNSPVSLIIRGSIFKYLNELDRSTLLNVVGAEVIVDYALQHAINDGVTILEWPAVPGVYVLGKDLVTLPVGFSFDGESRRTYTASSDASFNNVGTVLRLFNGASAIFKMTSRHSFRRVVFDGRNKSVRFMQGDDQTQWCRFYDCGVHRWYIGIGGSSPNGYSATLIFSGGTISSNTIGVKNVIDSLFLGATINANDTDGVQLLTGANNNAFIGVRNEWNNGDNYYGYGCKRILIQGELIDRAGKRAVAAVGGAQFVLSGVAVQRSGRLAAEGSVDDSHFYLEGDTSSIIITPSYTTAGMNDDGSGRLSPTYILATGGSNSDAKSFLASSSSLSGYAGATWLRSGTIASLSVQGCLGVEDIKNFGLRRISNGVQYLGDAVSGLSLSGAGNTATMVFTTTSQDFSRYSSEFIVRTLEITARNNTSTGSVARYSVDLIISREQASAAIAVDTTTVKTMVTLSGGTWGITSANPTGVSLGFAISADGKTLTVTLTAIDSASRLISAKLRA
ncbi:TPA: phage tail fiber protein [Klebsiella pneumoniae]|uniref:phage tail fiber domain-containing protein n=1 Tax=Klebsiella pneumoniae TaxID=573 RepID=UPI00092DB1DB|nr:phage tail fiber protein [Klebsiella pneumoniae]APM26766.1 phage tail protein [Klebsiella pneumoniae]EKW5597673.1 phage tail protein [Klebsiella pneumoniae]EMC5287822.1 phage tail protein [Klebsiella pneumoniae]MBD0011184.1 phage tail protein [Klebsiella pneumoniae]QIA82103.1 phage tail protein [Klebsiella pneumoniae]